MDLVGWAGWAGEGGKGLSLAEVSVYTTKARNPDSALAPLGAPYSLPVP